MGSKFERVGTKMTNPPAIRGIERRGKGALV